MLVFSAEFPASKGSTSEDLLDCCVQWFVRSDHYPWRKYSEADFVATENSITNYKKDGHTANLARVRISPTEELAGLQYVWTEKGNYHWTTEIVGRIDAKGLWVSVKIFCEVLATGLTLPQSKKPYIVKVLMKELGGGEDGEFVVSDLPRMLAVGELKLATDVINGNTVNELPVVYVSSSFRGRPLVDVKKLAQWMSGLCHILVEPNRAFSRELATMVDSRNVYGGAVGVYWPLATGENQRLIPEHFANSKEIEHTIQNIIRSKLTYARFGRSLTWVDLQESISKYRLDELRRTGSTSVDDYAAAFDAELGALNIQRNRLVGENERLREDIRRLQGAAPGIIALGLEQEIYPGEVLDVAIRALKEYSASAVKGSRRATVLEDLLRVNHVSDRSDRIATEIKRILSDASRIGATEISELEELGFVVEDGGKHYKATFAGDSRLSFTLHKTASDHRAGKNLASDIIRTLFK